MFECYDPDEINSSSNNSKSTKTKLIINKMNACTHLRQDCTEHCRALVISILNTNIRNASVKRAHSNSQKTCFTRTVALRSNRAQLNY